MASLLRAVYSGLPTSKSSPSASHLRASTSTNVPPQRRNSIPSLNSSAYRGNNVDLKNIPPIRRNIGNNISPMTRSITTSPNGRFQQYQQQSQHYGHASQGKRRDNGNTGVDVNGDGVADVVYDDNSDVQGAKMIGGDSSTWSPTGGILDRISETTGAVFDNSINPLVREFQLQIVRNIIAKLSWKVPSIFMVLSVVMVFMCYRCDRVDSTGQWFNSLEQPIFGVNGKTMGWIWMIISLLMGFSAYRVALKMPKLFSVYSNDIETINRAIDYLVYWFVHWFSLRMWVVVYDTRDLTIIFVYSLFILVLSTVVGRGFAWIDEVAGKLYRWIVYWHVYVTFLNWYYWYFTNSSRAST